MPENIKQIDLEVEIVIPERNLQSDRLVSSVDADQVSGRYLLVQPFEADGSYGGRVLIYPQSPQLEINEIVELKEFDRFGSLYYPLDARFDYVRRKIWIADTGNHRVLKVDLDSEVAQLEVADTIYYPHAQAVDVNIGGVFVKGYTSSNRETGIVYYLKSNGSILYSFTYGVNISSGSSSSSSSSSETLSSSSSSGEEIMPALPVASSIAYDHVRSRVWWVANEKIYMADTRNKQVQNYDLTADGFVDTRSIDVELKTGNAFVIAIDVNSDTYLIQMFRDNNVFLGSSYIKV